MTDSATPTAAPARALERSPSGALPIAGYGILSDCNSAALVGIDGAIDWLCLPRYDSPAVFSRILDADAGHWTLAPTAPFRSERRYRPGTLVLETVFTTDLGSVCVTDAMAFAAPHSALQPISDNGRSSVRPIAIAAMRYAPAMARIAT